MSLLLDILKYLFNPIPLGNFKYIYFFLGLAVLALVASIVLRLYLKKNKEDKIFRKLFRGVPGKLQLLAFVEALYVLARYENMPYLSMRIVNYIILVYGLYLIIRNLQIFIKVYPAEKKRHHEQLEANKYLPRKHSNRR